MHLFGGQIGPEGVQELQKLAENEQFDYNSSEPSKEPVLVECGRDNDAFAFQPHYPSGLCHAEQEVLPVPESRSAASAALGMKGRARRRTSEAQAGRRPSKTPTAPREMCPRAP